MPRRSATRAAALLGLLPLLLPIAAAMQPHVPKTLPAPGSGAEAPGEPRQAQTCSSSRDGGGGAAASGGFLLDDVPASAAAGLGPLTPAFLALADMAYGFDHISGRRRRPLAPCLAAWGARGPPVFIGGRTPRDDADRAAYVFRTQRDVFVAIRWGRRLMRRAGQDTPGRSGRWQRLDVGEATHAGRPAGTETHPQPGCQCPQPTPSLGPLAPHATPCQRHGRPVQPHQLHPHPPRLRPRVLWRAAATAAAADCRTAARVPHAAAAGGPRPVLGAGARWVGAVAAIVAWAGIF
jgi:hypothetical protein